MQTKELKICTKCGSTFLDNMALKNHEERANCIEKSEEYKKNRITVDGCTKYKCLICGKIFEDLYHIDEHQKNAYISFKSSNIGYQK